MVPATQKSLRLASLLLARRDGMGWEMLLGTLGGTLPFWQVSCLVSWILVRIPWACGRDGTRCR